ncbi:hypothetical protein ACPVPU_04240 [Sphingomonas sp. CJ99]
MTPDDEAATVARNRYFLMIGANLVGVAGAVFGLLLIGRAADTPSRLIGGALVLAALYWIAVVPRALARRWRSRSE